MGNSLYLQELIDWELHNLVNDPPRSSPAFHLVLLRDNLLTCYQGRVLHVLDRIIKTIAPYGLLIVGSHELLRLRLSTTGGVGGTVLMTE